MAKLYFRYGTMGSGKSLDLLKVAYNYEENGMGVLILTSKIDDRYGNDIIKSRTGLSKPAIGVGTTDNIFDIVDYKKNIMNDKIDCVIVDEVQFFNEKHIKEMIDVVDKFDIPVMCYGLRSDFKGDPFSNATNYLLANADDISEIKTICSKCGKKKATMNARFDQNSKIIKTGSTIEIGGNDKYKPMCRKCFNITN